MGRKMEIMEVPSAREGSWDKFLHFIDNDCIDNNGKNKLVIFSKDIDNIQNLIDQKGGEYCGNNNNNDKNDGNYENKDQRAIGVVYNPKYENMEIMFL